MRAHAAVFAAILASLPASAGRFGGAAAQTQEPAGPPSSRGTSYAIRAGRLIDPATGTSSANQLILVRDGIIRRSARGERFRPGRRS